MVEILPAILSKTSNDYHRKIKAVEGLCEWVQIDIVDNIYARNQTVDYKTVGSIRTPLKLEIQLMVERIENWVDPFIKLRPGRIIVPLESARNPLDLVNHFRRHGVPFGFSIEPKTPVERMQHVVDKIDMALLLAVHPGFSGQHFAHNVLDKIRKLRAMRPDLIIEIDGGIEPGTAAKCAQVGANILAAGSYIFGDGKMEEGSFNDRVKRSYDTLKEAVSEIIPEGSV